MSTGRLAACPEPLTVPSTIPFPPSRRTVFSAILCLLDCLVDLPTLSSIGLKAVVACLVIVVQVSIPVGLLDAVRVIHMRGELKVLSPHALTERAMIFRPTARRTALALGKLASHQRSPTSPMASILFHGIRTISVCGEV